LAGQREAEHAGGGVEERDHAPAMGHAGPALQECGHVKPTAAPGCPRERDGDRGGHRGGRRGPGRARELLAGAHVAADLTITVTWGTRASSSPTFPPVPWCAGAGGAASRD